jgi:plastocyanin
MMRLSAVLLCAGVLAACGGANQSSSSSVPASTGEQSSITNVPSTSVPAERAGSEVTISDFAYTVPASVSPGQQITIVNKDSANHTVTADADNLFDIRVSGGGGIETFTAPTSPGTYPFHCKYHANMHGSLTVQ